MRRDHLCICSTAHLPARERIEIDTLIARSPRRRGRIIVEHTDLSIEPHQYGFFVHLSVLDDHLERPDTLSPELWCLLAHAQASGAAWISFDCDEPPSSAFPIFEDDVLHHRATLPIDLAESQEPTMSERSTARHARHDEDAILRSLPTLEIALSDEELSIASTLEFDPDANPSPPLADVTLALPPVHAISGAAFSRRTWEKLAGRHFAAAPTSATPQPLKRFLEWRARWPVA